MIIVILLFSIFVMEILLEEIGSYVRSSKNLQKRKAAFDLMKIKRKFEQTRGHLAVLHNPLTEALYKQQMRDIARLESQCTPENLHGVDKTMAEMRYNEAVQPSPVRTILYDLWRTLRALFPLLIAVPLFWVNVKIDLDYQALNPLGGMLCGRPREHDVLHTRMHYYVIFVYAAHHRIKDILSPV
ncbi:MAG: hypothetical protein P4M11_10465 [Candidatus Pacebacteria bacterium]|nr:hypothetical protein [Candidatus Paceibacterota bacterium]